MENLSEKRSSIWKVDPYEKQNLENGVNVKRNSKRHSQRYYSIICQLVSLILDEESTASKMGTLENYSTASRALSHLYKGWGLPNGPLGIGSAPSGSRNDVIRERREPWWGGQRQYNWKQLERVSGSIGAQVDSIERVFLVARFTRSSYFARQFSNRTSYSPLNLKMSGAHAMGRLHLLEFQSWSKILPDSNRQDHRKKTILYMWSTKKSREC